MPDRNDLPDKRLVRRSFERAAASYDAAAVLQREVCSRLLERLDLIRFRPGRVLDLGCGTGQALDDLLRRYPRAQVLGLDLAPAMLERARRRGRWRRRPQAVCADAERLPFADASFDLVFSSLMIQWCVDPAGLFAEMRRVLRPGGLFLFSGFGPDTLRELRQAWRAVDSHVHVNHFPDLHTLGDALLAAGFADPVMDVERITLTYSDIHGLMRDLKQIGAHNVTRGRPRGLTGRARLRRLEQAYEDFRREGVLPATWEVLNGLAWQPQPGQVEVRLAGSPDRSGAGP
ncbi:MAG TPA: malonyl-[acyl-carrier protein] O-methyltransferase BioC [Gammaproteobacteria bacterium]|nr:malonyl-[acyl-carrier protein] O-methyltransferase BioC [Gammaproteobacteria bacterium]